MALSARKHLAHRIKALRHSYGWSQEVLAELCGLNRSYIGAVERGEHNIGLDNIERIAHALEISITELLSEPETAIPVNTQSAPDQSLRQSTHPVVIHRQCLLDLIELTKRRNGELILTYLERCGAIIRDP